MHCKKNIKYVGQCSIVDYLIRLHSLRFNSVLCFFIVTPCWYASFSCMKTPKFTHCPVKRADWFWRVICGIC